MIILPCNNPPAVEFILWGADGEVLVNETLVKTRRRPITYGGLPLFDLVVEVRHVTSPQDAIVVKVSLCVRVQVCMFVCADDSSSWCMVIRV